MSVVKKICSVKDLNELRDSSGQCAVATEQINVCIGGGCIASGSLDVKAAFEEALKSQGLETKISIIGTGCLGPCAHGPVVVIGKDNVFYKNVSFAVYRSFERTGTLCDFCCFQDILDLA